MKIFRSLAFLIFLTLTLLACSTLYLGYQLNIHTLRETMEARELDKVQNIYSIIDSMINEETRHAAGFAKILQQSQKLAAGLSFFYRSGGDFTALKEAMDQSYPQLKTLQSDIFLVTDRFGKVIYRADLPADRGRLYRVWGMEEALAGEDIVSAG